jgi:hypothetical protein
MSATLRVLLRPGWLFVASSLAACPVGRSSARWSALPPPSSGRRRDRRPCPACPLTWAFTVERVTRIELALSAWESDRSGAFDRTELGNRCAASDRQGPCGIRANGPPMAHGLMAGGRWPIGKDRSGGGDRLEALWLLHMLLHASLTSVICADWGPLRYPPRGGLPDRAVRSKHVRLAAGLTLQAYCRRAGCWAAPHQCRGE